MLEIRQIALIVQDYDEALEYYTNTLGFVLVGDTRISEEKRWIVIAPSHASPVNLLLAKAVTPEQLSRVGNQTGDRVFLFLYTRDFELTYKQFSEKGVEFIQKPRDEDYGRVVVFRDLYGNKWDLIEKKKPAA
ncbi:MAG: VOC family protein [Spirochaetes bacterium]|nr:VOC family protein [Spirochaetota bacterium]